MNIKELRECNGERLEELSKTLRRQLFDARIKNFTSQLDDTATIRRTRRDLARVYTLLREGAAPEGASTSSASPASDSPTSGKETS